MVFLPPHKPILFISIRTTLKCENGVIVNLTNNTIKFGTDIIKKGDEYYIILSSPELTGSIFIKLFYYEGEGVTYFDKFSDVRDVTGAKIIVWKVDREGK